MHLPTWCHRDSAIVTWGDADRGGDSSAVRRDQLKGVQQIQATNFAFAAILELPGVMVVTVQQFEIRPIHLQNGSRGMSSGKANSFPC